jgi:hypothetical protein
MSDDRFEEPLEPIGRPPCRFCDRVTLFGTYCCPEMAAAIKDAVKRQPGGLAEVELVTADDIEEWLETEAE